MDNRQGAIHAQAKNVALTRLSMVATGELDVAAARRTEQARWAGATEQEIFDALVYRRVGALKVFT
jgi:hypothetical protein